MTPTRPFSPGQPIGPYDGFSRTPRTHDFVSGYNVAARPKSHERVSFDTLRGLVEAYDVAQMCIWHRIDSIRALNWSVVPARGFKGDADAAISQGMAALEKPDRQTPFGNWLAKWLYDVLAYDAGTLYRLRNRGGRVIGLRPVDGTTIAPLLDYWGQIPEPPAEGFVQYVNGLPWNWLTRNDLIYEPFRPRTNSPYGVAPLEAILLNANTDLRFQAYFLQRFTSGNIPEAFASAPETWTPEQIEQFQGYWDQLLLGDQAVKHQIKWIPGGSTIAWSNEKNFEDTFSLFLMRKTCAAYHVTPADLGFTENVNRSSGETQADVQHRVGDLPLITYVQGVLTHFLRHDLNLPVEFSFDTGQEKEDRLTLAQAWQIYIESGMASPDEGRETLLGLPSDPRRPTPRFFNAGRYGPIPLLSLNGAGGHISPETFAPADDQPILPQPFVAAPGVVPAEGTADAEAAAEAEDTYQTAVRETAQESAAAAVAKDASAGATTDVTTATGITSYDLIGQDDEEENTPLNDERVQSAKAETIAFRRFAKARRRARTWRDFEFRHVDARTARRLNQAGRAAVRKDAGEIAVAGLAVRAADTGRVLMLQRALDPDDPAGGTWEFPGGYLEGNEVPVAGATREWSEETGFILPFDPEGMAALAFAAPAWTTGIYAGFVYTVPSESVLDLTRRGQVTNPDDPDGDVLEAIAWWDPAQLRGNHAVRPELLESLDLVLGALGCRTGEEPQPGEERMCPCGMTARFDEMDGWQHLDGSHGHDDDESVAEKLGFAKAAADPKGDAPTQGAPQWPGWALDEECAGYWAQALASATGGVLTAAQAEQLARDYQAVQPPPDDSAAVEVLAAAAVLWLATRINLTAPLTRVLQALYADAYLIGAASARALLDGSVPNTAGWAPGDTATARRLVASLNVSDGLQALASTVSDLVEQTTASRLKDVARELIKGVRAGQDDAAIGRAIRNVLGSVSRARTVAQTETTRGSSHAAITVYRQQGKALGVWLIDPSNPCRVCQANSAASPLPLGDPYPSGDLYPPVHPNCRCALVAV
ncbi:phage portal protein [Streptomyces cavernae]|uniref:phage portal protein n=1 Tax=Streptomyces cavernae TaxID=2259034 RepID=UPI001390CDEB|nr:phage portal protein [Streptomyces cavernae]